MSALFCNDNTTNTALAHQRERFLVILLFAGASEKAHGISHGISIVIRRRGGVGGIFFPGGSNGCCRNADAWHEGKNGESNARTIHSSNGRHADGAASSHRCRRRNGFRRHRLVVFHQRLSLLVNRIATATLFLRESSTKITVGSKCTGVNEKYFFYGPKPPCGGDDGTFAKCRSACDSILQTYRNSYVVLAGGKVQKKSCSCGIKKIVLLLVPYAPAHNAINSRFWRI